MKSVQDIRSIIEALPVFETIKGGTVKNHCSTIARGIRDDLNTAGVPTIMVGGVAGNPRNAYHYYCYCQTDEGMRMVDGTAGQDIPALQGKLFIGTRDQMMQIAREHNPDENWDEIWSPTPKLWREGKRIDPATQKMLLQQLEDIGIKVGNIGPSTLGAAASKAASASPLFSPPANGRG